jgi:nitrite reductase (NO-forming)
MMYWVGLIDMDMGVYRASVLMIIMGIVGVWLAYFAGISESFFELGGISVLLLVLGLILLPVGLFKGGPPDFRAYLPVVLVVILGVGLVGMPLLVPGEQVVESGRTVTIYLVSKEWAFNETNPTITVYLGDRVRVILYNEGEIPHQFGVVGFEGSDTDIVPSGGTVEVEFIASRVGEFTYVCPIPGHADLGMKGKFIVLPPEES